MVQTSTLFKAMPHAMDEMTFYILYIKGCRDEMKLSIHPSLRPSHHPSMDGII
jgi:hypothetical protein